MTEPKILTADDVDALEKGWGYIKRHPNHSIRVRDRDMCQDVVDLCATVRALRSKPRSATTTKTVPHPDDEPINRPPKTPGYAAQPAPAKKKRGKRESKR